MSNIKDLLLSELKEFGAEVGATAEELREFAALEAIELARLSGLPGFQLAAEAAADKVRMRAKIAAVDKSESADRRARAILLAYLLGASGA